MSKLLFTTRHAVLQGDGKGPVYQAGKAYLFEGRVGETYAEKYKRRGYAVDAPAGMRAENEPMPTAQEIEAAERAEAARLEAERIAAEAARIKARGEIAIPDEWSDLPWKDLRLLANSVSDDFVRSKEEASEAIEAELKRRADATV